MQPDDLDRLADQIVNGAEIDWAAIEASVSARDAGLLQQLRVLQEIGRVHQTPQSEPVAAIPPVASRWRHLDVRNRIAGGAYGDVYRAWDPHLDREVALKLLRCASEPLNRAASELIHEAQLLARVRHPNVITIYGAERLDGCPGLWMELVDGWTLAEIIQIAGTLSASETVLLGLTLCRALSAVHRAGVLHRDIKAQNVMRQRGGRIVLMDFGAGHMWDVAPELSGVMGTPLYLPPEMMENGSFTAAGDIYSLGVLLYYAAAGEFPVSGPSIDDIRAAHAAGKRTYLHDARPELPGGFVRVIERALSREPSHRYQSAGEMEAALAHSLGFHPGA